MDYGAVVAVPNFATRTIWIGDNLDVMRGMNSESVDLIYLDPPFNSNRDYAAPIGSASAGAAFKDTWTLSDLDVAWAGYIADEHPAVAYLLSGSGMVHSKGMQSYLTMMAVRALEMRRLLKPTGTLYLHCDTTASHYLKLLLDSVFGPEMFLNEITWKRSSAHSDTKQGMRRAGKIRDVLLVYTSGGEHIWNAQFTPYADDYLVAEYRHVSIDGRRYKQTDVTAAKPGGDTKYEWHVKRLAGGEWEPDLSDEYRTPQPAWEYKAVNPYKGRYWAYSKANLRRFWLEGKLAHRSTGMPRLMQFADEMPGVPLQDLWDDIAPVSGNERTGYPTQKPLTLLERIIALSSNPGDVVLDPFAGCATACVAAEKLDRQWVGIDLSSKAAELVNSRLRTEMGDLFHWGFVVERTDIPQRTDIEAPKNYRENKHILYGTQEGQCNGCRSYFEFRHFEIDHIIPRSRGGTNHLDNLQLLCGHCNRVKGDRDMPYLLAELASRGHLVTV